MLTTHTQAAQVSSTDEQNQRNHCGQFFHTDITTQGYSEKNCHQLTAVWHSSSQSWHTDQTVLQLWRVRLHTVSLWKDSKMQYMCRHTLNHELFKEKSLVCELWTDTQDMTENSVQNF